MGRLEKLWGPDATSFNPARFMTARQPSQYQFMAFNAGPRLCLGKNLAYLEAQTALALIWRYFDLELALKEGEEVTYVNALTLPIKNGLPVRVRRRQ